MADDKKDDDGAEDPAAEYSLMSSPEAIQAFFEKAAQMDKPGRCKFSVYTMLTAVRHESLKYVTDEVFSILVHNMLSSYAWAVRVELLELMMSTMASKGEFDMAAANEDTKKRFDASLVELSKYIDFVSEPSKGEKERPQ